jgi:hypothetical protein
MQLAQDGIYVEFRGVIRDVEARGDQLVAQPFASISRTSISLAVSGSTSASRVPVCITGSLHPPDQAGLGPQMPAPGLIAMIVASRPTIVGSNKMDFAAVMVGYVMLGHFSP